MYIAITRSKDKQWYFTVRASNHKVCTTSKTYTRYRDAVRAANRHIDEWVRGFALAEKDVDRAAIQIRTTHAGGRPPHVDRH